MVRKALSAEGEYLQSCCERVESKDLGETPREVLIVLLHSGGAELIGKINKFAGWDQETMMVKNPDGKGVVKARGRICFWLECCYAVSQIAHRGLRSDPYGVVRGLFKGDITVPMTRKRYGQGHIYRESYSWIQSCVMGMDKPDQIASKILFSKIKEIMTSIREGCALADFVNASDDLSAKEAALLFEIMSDSKNSSCREILAQYNQLMILKAEMANGADLDSASKMAEISPSSQKIFFPLLKI